MAAVDQASYRPWEGTAKPSRLAVFAIAGTMIRRLMRLRLVRWPVILVSLFAIILSSLLFGIGTIAGEGPMGRMFQRAGPEIDQLALAIRAQLPQILFFSALAFAWLRWSGLYPPELHSVNLDVDWLWRRPGRIVVHGVAVAVLVVDGVVRRVAFALSRGMLISVMRAHGPTGVLARNWPMASIMIWVTVLLTGYLLLYFGRTG